MIIRQFNKKALNRRILSLIAIGIFTIFFFEIILRATYPLYASYNTEMWRYAVELKQLSEFPNLNHEHIPNKTAQLYGVEFKTNSLGLRADREYAIPKPNNTTRILVLGDSVTAGWGVDYENTYPKLLESLLSDHYQIKFEVINAGVGNYNSAFELAALKKFIKLEPDVIVLGFYFNDIESIPYSSKLSYSIKSKFYLYAFLFDKFLDLKLRGVTAKSYKAYYGALYNDIIHRGETRKAITEMIDIATSNSTQFVLVNIPELHEAKFAQSEVQAFLLDIVNESPEIMYIDLADFFDDYTVASLMVSKVDPHPNAEGHGIIAEALFDILLENNVFNAK